MLSIIIPTLNEEKILEKTLVSLRRLRNLSYEVIISDGCSTDKTISIAKQYADIVVLHDGKTRQTIAEGKNSGAMAASRDYLVFMDADVFIPDIDNFFNHALGLFEKNPKLLGLTVFLKVLPEKVTLSDKLFFGLVNRIFQVSNNILHIGAASGEFQMIRKETFLKMGGYDKKLIVGEDNDMFSRLSKIGSTYVAAGLHVMHTSRRAHSIGWTGLLSLWIGNFIFAKVARKSWSSEWKVIR